MNLSDFDGINRTEGGNITGKKPLLMHKVFILKFL